MKYNNYNKISLLFVCAQIILCATSFAQSNARKGWDGLVKGGSKSVLLNFGASVISPGSTLKDKANFSNSVGINADAFIPFIASRKGWDGVVKGGSFGINIGGSYNLGGNANLSTGLPKAFAVSGQTSSNVAYKGVDPRNPGFRIGAGPQVNFYFGEKVSAGIMLLGEYFSTTQKSLSIVQSTSFEGKNYDFALRNTPETKTTGFALTPKLRLDYMFSRCIGLFAEGGYTTGPSIQTASTRLVPNGVATQEGNYDIKQLQTGTMVKGETIKTSYSAMNVGGGITIRFGRKKGWNGRSEANINTSRSNIKQQYSGNVSDTTSAEPAKANINTSRSNKKQQISTKNTGDSTTSPEPANAEINRSRSNIKNQIKKDNGQDSISNPVKLKDGMPTGRRTWSPIAINPTTTTVARLKDAKFTEVVSVSLQSSGKTTKAGLPIVEGNTVMGTLTGMPAGTIVKIHQAYTGDEGSTVTDEKGNFSIVLHHDTEHIIYLNGEEYGKIKMKGTGKK